MTPALRKTHRLIWMILPLLFPLLFWATISQKPSPALETTLAKETPPALAKVWKSQNRIDFLFNLRQANSGEMQVEVILKKPLSNPSAGVVYTADVNTSRPQILGELGAQDLYRFPLPSTAISDSLSHQIDIYDAIKKEKLASFMW